MARKNDICIGTYRTRREAQTALDRLTDSQITDRYNLTFAEVYAIWEAEKGRETTRKAMAIYDLMYRKSERLHKRKIREITRSEYQAIIIDLEQSGMSKSTCRKAISLFTSMSKWAVLEGIMPESHAEGLTTTAEQKTERKIFSESEIQRMKESQNPAADIALILISSGARPTELFRAALGDCREDHIIGGSKTEAGKNRVIPIGPDGLGPYRRMMAESPGPLLIDGYRGNNKGSANFARREWRDLMTEIGCSGMTPYSCRHTFVTRSIRGGMELAKLEAIVGHLDRETTKLYTHLNAADLVEATAQSVTNP